MTTTEEIVVSGEDFIERRIYVSPEPRELEEEIVRSQRTAFQHGYSRGWRRGFFAGFCVLAAIALLFCWAVQI
jgi:hypothetical protein